MTELVGDMILNCTGGVATAAGAVVPQVNFQIFLNTNVTSKFSSDPWTEALLLIDDPVPAVQRTYQGPYAATGTGALTGINYGAGGTVPNVYQGRKASDNSIAWLGVPIDPPGTTATRIIRMTNIRANAFQLGVSSTLIPTQIVMFVSATGTTSIPINNPQQTVAYIQNGMSPSVRLADDSDTTTGLKMLQCNNWNKDMSTDSSKTYATGNGRVVTLRFSEGFASAFKTIGGNDQNVPGGIFNTESGFTNSAFPSTGNLNLAGRASQGTRLMARFNNIPAGVVLYVSTLKVSGSSSISAVLVTTDLNGAGAYSPVTATSTSDGGLAPVTLSGGSGVAVWEVTGADPLAIENVRFAVAVAYTANTASNLPGLGTATVNMSFAPLSTIGKMDAAAPHPRFADDSSARTIFILNACVTNLLFPYLTNQAGFDSGVVIANTSLDPFGTVTQAGACKLNYYGETTGGGAAPAAQTSGSLAAGKSLLFTLSTGGNLGIAATPGFSGYMIAQCAFQYAHGFAFISDVGAQRLAESYLALIMDEHVGTRTGSKSESLGQ